MSFDSVFHGAPTSNNGQAIPSGNASFGIDLTSGKLYFKTPIVAGWQQLAGEFSSPGAVGGSTPLLNATVKTVDPSVALGTGDIGLYTVPTGKRAYACLMVFNDTVTNPITFYPVVNLAGAGVYYRLGNNTAIAPGVSSNGQYNGFIFEAGDRIGINVNTAAVSVRLFIIEFDSTTPLKSARVVLSSGDNTVYTCPSGKVAILHTSLWFNVGIGQFTASNESGGPLNYKWNIVPVGGSPSTLNQVSSTIAISNNAIGFSGNFYSAWHAGDFVNVNTSGSGKQLSWLTVLELPA